MTKQAEWNAERYHEVSRPHEFWGAEVLDRVPRDGISIAIDAGCGTGKITAELLERLPDATVYALDISPSMLAVAERELAPRYGDRVHFRQVDLARVSPDQVGQTADLIFSTAAFHWVKDHDLLFRRMFDLLNPGGRLIAQCGGGPNLHRTHEHIDRLIRSPQFARYFEGWTDPWFFADAGETAERLRAAGFRDVDTYVEYRPAQMANAEEYRSFVSTVILREHLARLPDEQLRAAFVAELARQAAEEEPRFELDYWRLNMMAARPASIV